MHGECISVGSKVPIHGRRTPAFHTQQETLSMTLNSAGEFDSAQLPLQDWNHWYSRFSRSGHSFKLQQVRVPTTIPFAQRSCTFSWTLLIPKSLAVHHWLLLQQQGVLVCLDASSKDKNVWDTLPIVSTGPCILSFHDPNERVNFHLPRQQGWRDSVRSLGDVFILAMLPAQRPRIPQRRNTHENSLAHFRHSFSLSASWN